MSAVHVQVKPRIAFYPRTKYIADFNFQTVSQHTNLIELPVNLLKH